MKMTGLIRHTAQRNISIHQDKQNPLPLHQLNLRAQPQHPTSASPTSDPQGRSLLSTGMYTLPTHGLRILWEGKCGGSFLRTGWKG